MQTHAENNEATTTSLDTDEAAACHKCKTIVNLSGFSKKQRKKIKKGQPGICMQCVGPTSNVSSAKRNPKGGASGPTTSNSTKKTSAATSAKCTKQFEVCSGVCLLKGAALYHRHYIYTCAYVQSCTHTHTSLIYVTDKPPRVFVRHRIFVRPNDL